MEAFYKAYRQYTQKYITCYLVTYSKIFIANKNHISHSCFVGLQSFTYSVRNMSYGQFVQMVTTESYKTVSIYAMSTVMPFTLLSKNVRLLKTPIILSFIFQSNPLPECCEMFCISFVTYLLW